MKNIRNKEIRIITTDNCKTQAHEAKTMKLFKKIIQQNHNKNSKRKVPYQFEKEV